MLHRLRTCPTRAKAPPPPFPVHRCFSPLDRPKPASPLLHTRTRTPTAPPQVLPHPPPPCTPFAPRAPNAHPPPRPHPEPSLLQAASFHAGAVATAALLPSVEERGIVSEEAEFVSVGDDGVIRCTGCRSLALLATAVPATDATASTAAATATSRLVAVGFSDGARRSPSSLPPAVPLLKPIKTHWTRPPTTPLPSTHPPKPPQISSSPPHKVRRARLQVCSACTSVTVRPSSSCTARGSRRSL